MLSKVILLGEKGAELIGKPNLSRDVVTIEAVGPEWAVIRDRFSRDKIPYFARFENPLCLAEMIKILES